MYENIDSEKYSAYDYDSTSREDDCPAKQIVPEYGFGVRHCQLLIFTMCLMANFITRAHMGVTIVAMTENKRDGNTNCVNESASIDGISETDYLTTSDNAEENVSWENIIDEKLDNDETQYFSLTYDWPISTQEIVLAAFFVGYAVMTLPAGMICQRWGGKFPFQMSLLISGIFSIVTPWLTYWKGWKGISLCRFIQGLAQAGIYPSMQALLAKWVPVCERARLSTYVYTGSSLGNILAYQLGGYLGASHYGWPATFWAIGVICLVCFIILTVFGAASPQEHMTISEEEKSFILGRTITDDENVKRPKTQWKAMLKCIPLWAIIAAQIGSGISYIFFFIQVPSYIHYILGVSVQNSGFLSSLPYIASLFSSLALGWISDYCTNNNIISIKNARRISNSFSQIGIALALIFVSYTRNIILAVTCLVIAMICHMGIHTGWMINYIDLAPNFTGIMMACGNTLLNIINALLAYVVAHIITDMKNVVQWRIMFFIVAGTCLVTNLIFVLFMSADVQPWNDPESDEPEDIEDIINLEETENENE